MLLPAVEIKLSFQEKKKESLTHKEKGNTCFKTGQYEEAVSAYTMGLRICPISFPKERSVLYANRAAARSKMVRSIYLCCYSAVLDISYIPVTAIAIVTIQLLCSTFGINSSLITVLLLFFQDKKKEAIKDCTNAIDLDSTYLKAILRRATLNEETEQLDEALKDFQQVLELDPSHAEAQRAVRVRILHIFVLNWFYIFEVFIESVWLII